MATATITIEVQEMDLQTLEQTCEDMLEYWFDWANDEEVKTKVSVEG